MRSLKKSTTSTPNALGTFNRNLEKNTAIEVNRHQCSCGKTYKYREGLYKHQRYECGKEPQFPCPKCSYKSYHKGNLKKHVVLKHSDFCTLGGIFDWFGNERITLPGSYTCKGCGKSYHHAQSLYKHRRFECGKRPQFQCPYCSYCAKHKVHLKRHLVGKHCDHANNKSCS
ncbi:hypothetical protein O3M35_011197 [Rhynocoris fuscipes]|uniref:C2H2-type domain-containing protein n=1 Tax=Rhynocoris fuscipes TaxID=488301 RepID=A0AAW1CWN6_9HEMI